MSQLSEACDRLTSAGAVDIIQYMAATLFKEWVL